MKYSQHHGGRCITAKIAWTLVIIGAINWGLVGAFNLDLVDVIFGRISWLQDLVYIFVGLSGLISLFGCPCKKCRSACSAEGCTICGSKKEKNNPTASSMDAVTTMDEEPPVMGAGSSGDNFQ